MLYQSHLISAASGKLSGMVASRNRGGPYLRAHVIPIDPATAEQLEMRTSMSDCSTEWRTVLSADLRQQWEAFARTVRVPNRLGDLRQVGGYQLFCRVNVPRIQANFHTSSGISILNSPPSSLYQSEDVLPTVALSTATNTNVQITWGSSPAWAGGSESMSVLFASGPVSQFVNRYFGPWTLIDGMNGSDFSTPYFPDLTPGITPNSGQRVFWKRRVHFGDGSASNFQYGFVQIP